MKEQSVTITLKKQQIVNDVSVQCGVIGRTLQKSPESEEQAAEIMTPDDVETKPIVARSIVEAWGEVKKVCQRYLSAGRVSDDNRLEGIATKTTTEGGEEVTTYGEFVLALTMPASFNIGLTETVKSNAHRMIVDYTMRAVLADQWPEKAAEYERLYAYDIENLRASLRARLRMTRRAVDWS